MYSSGLARWRRLARLVGVDEGDADASTLSNAGEIVDPVFDAVALLVGDLAAARAEMASLRAATEGVGFVR